MTSWKNEIPDDTAKICCTNCGSKISTALALNFLNFVDVCSKRKQQLKLLHTFPSSLNRQIIMLVFMGVFLAFWLLVSTTPAKNPKSERFVQNHENVVQMYKNLLQSKINPKFEQIGDAAPGSLLAEPILRRKKRSRRKREKCRKNLRKTFCMNNGRCRWIPDMNQASCRCPKGWRGERCQKPLIELSTDNNRPSMHTDNTITIALVLSGFGMLVLVVAIFFCWRRFASIKKHLQQNDVGLEKQRILTEKQSTNSLMNSSIE